MKQVVSSKLGFVLASALAVALSGCAVQKVHVSAPKEPVTQVPDENGLGYRPDSRDAMQQYSQPPSHLYLTPKTLYNAPFTHKGLAGYAEQLTMALMDNARMLDNSSRIGVASFVELNSSLQTTNVLGNQLAEMLIAEVQQYGVSVVDYKVTDGISVDEYGDFVFSRNSWDLSSGGVEFVLAGTLIRNEKGVKVNARIVKLGSNVVVSSATGFIPHFIISELTPKVVAL